MRLPALAWTLLSLAPLAAQEEEPEDHSSRDLTAEQVEQRLDQVKRDLLPKVWTEKEAKDPVRAKKYLATWHAVTSEHYILFTNGPTASCKKYAVTLEEQYERVKKELPFEDVDHLLVCYIFKMPEEYYRFCGVATGWSEEQARATAGHATSAYYACYYESPHSAVVFHEATHQIVGACLKVPGVGSWFQEGLAVYFEKKAVGEKPAGVVKSDIKSGNYYALRDFFAIDTLLSDPQGNGHRNYAHAGALLDFLINTDEKPVAGKFGDFLAAARRGRGFAYGGKASEKLIKEVYGLSADELEDVWKKHLGLR
ncbi:MAG: DUF1570 domain-containing protein [Planctomycetota bacterium]